MKKILVALLLLLLVGIGYSYTWTYTPDGRLDYRAAASLKLLSFEHSFQPDPELDFEFKLPVNLIYAANGLLPTEKVSKTEDVRIPGVNSDGEADGQHEVPARVYWPAKAIHAAQPLPVIVYYHGGGFVVGSVDIFDPLTRSLANATGAIVISVDYRLAPRHPYPAAPNDAYAALLWAADNARRLGGDPARIIVAGDSAGADLAAVTALQARDKQGPTIAAQILYYPCTDLTGHRYPSREKFLDGFGLSSEAAAAFEQAYVGHIEDRKQAYVSPVYAPDLSGLPHTLMITAGFDPLRDGGTTYARRLLKQGTPVKLLNYADTIHGFMSVKLFPQRAQGLQDTRTFLNQLWATRAQQSLPEAVSEQAGHENIAGEQTENPPEPSDQAANTDFE